MLNNHTHYSLHYGSLSIKELLEEVSKNSFRDEFGWGSCVLTDINNTSATLNFIQLAAAYKIRPIIGIDFRNGINQQFIGIAQNNNGFLQLNQFLTSYLKQGKAIPQKAPSIEDCFIIYPIEKYTGFPLKPWEYVGIKHNQLFHKSIRNREIPLHRLVALQTGTFRNKRDFNTHRLLRAIDNNTLLSKLSIHEQSSHLDVFMNWEEFTEKFHQHPKLIKNTAFILNTAQIEFDFKSSKNKKVVGSSEEVDFIQLQYLAYLGYSERYTNPSKASKKRLEKELTSIKKLGFTAYFLITWDIIQYARKKGYYYVGRGSGSNSMVAYCLYITNVDPIDLDLYFERFINEHRKSPPDFDLDFSWNERDHIIHYIFQKYDSKHTAILATYNTFKYKSAIRELSKVFGLPKKEIDSLIYSNSTQQDSLTNLTLKYSTIIQNFPNHLGIHAGGIVISELPINYYTAQNLPPKGFLTTQFSMQEAEDIGLHKFDILSQRGLGKIKDAIKIVKQNQNIDISKTIENIEYLKKDSKIKTQLKKGNTIGCFYVESPGMRMLLSKLNADDYTRLVAASSIIRPGVSKSGMMQEYIKRFRHPEKRKYTHPKLAKLMAETYGVMIYQEDVLKVAHFFAGLTLEESDILRRGMSWKFKEQNAFHLVKDKFFTNCKKYGYSNEITHEVWKQIESFGNYAFSKGHSASYAVESYQSLYVKAYYPLEYMVATLNNGGGFYNAETYIHEAKIQGANIHGPCVNNSGMLTKIYDKELFLGLGMIRELSHHVIQQIEHVKNKNGSFQNFIDFTNRVQIPLKQLNLLIRCGALRFTNKTKKELLWESCLSYSDSKSNTAPKLFFENTKKTTMPNLEYHEHEDDFDELELLGFPLCSPFLLVKTKPQYYINVKDMPENIHQEVTMIGYLVSIKKTATRNGHIMYFGTFTDEKGAFLDSVHFPKIATKYPFRGKGVYALKGRITSEFDFYSLEVNWMERLYYKKDKRYN